MSTEVVILFVYLIQGYVKGKWSYDVIVELGILEESTPGHELLSVVFFQTV